MPEATYTYEQALQDAPQHVKRRKDLPTEPGWYVCEDDEGRYHLRWFDDQSFGVFCDQKDADDKGWLDELAVEKTARKILGWCKPWWTKEPK